MLACVTCPCPRAVCTVSRGENDWHIMDALELLAARDELTKCRFVCSSVRSIMFLCVRPPLSQHVVTACRALSRRRTSVFLLALSAALPRAATGSIPPTVVSWLLSSSWCSCSIFSAGPTFPAVCSSLPGSDSPVSFCCQVSIPKITALSLHTATGLCGTRWAMGCHMRILTSLFSSLKTPMRLKLLSRY